MVQHNMPDYDREYSEFTWDIPEKFNFGFDVIDKWAAAANKVALVSIDDSLRKARRHTFQDLSRLSNQCANVLKSAGIRRGNRVLIMLPSVPEWYITVLGCIKLGAVFMPTPTLCSSHDIEYRLKQSRATTVITNSELAERLQDTRQCCSSTKTFILTDGDRDGWINLEREMGQASEVFKPRRATRSTDPLLIYFTSGATGFPKMVAHAGAYALAHIVTAKYVHDLTAADLHWTIADTGWAKTAWGRLFGQWILGTAVLQHDASGKYDPAKTLSLLEKYGVTTFCAPPTVYRMLVKEDLGAYKLSKLRHCVSVGEPLNPVVINTWEGATGLKIHDCYGQTESVCLVANYPCMPIKPGSMGKPTPGHVVAIVDDEGNELPAGKQGMIAVKVKPAYPPGLLREYWKDPEAMEKSFRGDWYYTGDLAYTDDDGYFWFVGRGDDVIKSSGYRIGPFEVESALQEHPAVAESAVIGVPDPVRGQIVKAYIVLAPQYVGSDKLTEDLQNLVKRVTAPYKYPRQIEYVAALPKTISGKILRSTLREEAARKIATK